MASLPENTRVMKLAQVSGIGIFKKRDMIRRSRLVFMNKTQTAVINILNLFILIMTLRFVCAPYTYKMIRGLETRLRTVPTN